MAESIPLHETRSTFTTDHGTDTDTHSRAANMRDAATLLLRVWLGAVMITHGWSKLFGGITGLTEGVAEMGFPAPEIFAWAAALSEVVGGLFVALGLATRVSALFIAATMGVAAFVAHAEDPFGRKELALAYLAISVALLLLGPGRFALDHLITTARRNRRSRRAV